jgi:hypothetical protein
LTEIALVPIPPEKVDNIAMQATTRGQVIGLNIAGTSDLGTEAPPG